MNTTQDRPAVLTVEEAAKVLRIGRGSAYNLVRTGELPSIKLGRRLLVPTTELDRLLGTHSAN